MGLREATAAFLAWAWCFAATAADNVYRLPIGDPARRDKEAPVVLDAITDTSGGGLLTPGELPQRLSGVRLLLIGESHTDMESHRIEKRVLEELVTAGRNVTLGVEMYPYTAQPVLDDWTAGKMTEEQFLEASRWYANWGYNWLYYRDIFLFARDHRLRLVAINAPREVVSAVRKKGFQGLTPEEAAHVAADVDSKNADHLRLFKASFDEGSFHAGMDDAAWQSMLDAQCTWDATMGLHAVQPLAGNDDPKAIVVVLVGSGHVQYGMGIERQVKRRFAGRVGSLIPVPVRDEDGPVPAVQASYASFVWGVPEEGDPLYPELGVATRVRAEGGLEAIDVEEGSPAASAGLRVKDVLVSIDGVALPDRVSLARAMAGKRWGDSAVLSVRRDGQPVPVTVLLRRKAPAS